MTGVDSFAATAKMLVLTRRWSIHLDTDIISSTLTNNPTGHFVLSDKAKFGNVSKVLQRQIKEIYDLSVIKVFYQSQV